MSKFDPEKLKALQASKSAKIGGVRVAKAAPPKSSIVEDIKVTGAVTKLGARVIPNVSEVNFINNDGTVTQFGKPKFIAAMQHNTYAISGKGHTVGLMEAMTKDQGFISHLGMEGIQQLQKLLPQMGGMPGAADEGDDAPELVDA